LVVSLVLAAAATQAQGGRLIEKPEVADAVKLLDLWIGEQVAAGRAPGLSIAIVHDQELVWSHGYGYAELAAKRPATARTLYRIGSVSKLFTATAVMQLRDAGRLSLDDPVSKWVPEFAGVVNPFADTGEVTLRELLTQSSGLTREAPIPYWTTHVFPSRQELLASLRGLKMTAPPGETYKYSNLGLALLGITVENVSGLPWAEYVRRNIFEPLGMGDSTGAPTAEQIRTRAVAYYRRMADGSRPAFDYYDMNGMAAAGNIVSTVEDLARFAMLQFRDGPAGGEQVLRGATLREMHRAQFVYPSFSGGRGLGFGVSRSDGTTFVTHGGWIGGNRTHFLTVPSEKIAVVVAANADDADPYFFSRKAYDVVAPAIAAATASPKPAREPDPEWQRLLGTYTDPWGWEYEVMILDGGLVFYEHNYPAEEDPRDGITRLTPTGPLAFVMSDREPVVFEIGDDGKVKRIRRRFEYLTPAER